jgi:DNA adenine methylase
MKYMGSKARVAKDILSIILKDRKVGQWYVEPFCGGCNVIDKVAGNRIANDINAPLVAMWCELVNNNWHPAKISKDEYSKIRSNQNDYPLHVVGWVGFNCSYSGKWFGGFAGKVRTKLNTIRDYQDEAFKNTLKQVSLLKNVAFKSCQYHQLDIPDNSIVYCDQPYKDTTSYGTNFNHDIFWDWVRELSKNGHIVYVSEYAAPADFECVWQKRVSSSLSANGTCGGNKLSTEKLFKIQP